MQELITMLNRAEVLGKLTDIQKQQLASMAVRRALRRDEILYEQGTLWSNVLFITEGQLRSVIHSLDGRSYVVSTWGKGDEFWAHTLFDGEPMPATLEAVQESVIYQWEGEAALRTLFENSGAVRALLRRLIKLIRKRRETISDLAFQPVTGRLAKLLLEWVPASETSAQRDLTLDQIASMVASSPEVVCRTLYQLQRGGMLEITRASITLNDREALENLVSQD